MDEFLPRNTRSTLINIQICDSYAEEVPRKSYRGELTIFYAESVNDLVGDSTALALSGASCYMLGPRASLPAMSALARNIEDALPLSVTQSSQHCL
jgi:hypothetical protein